MKTNSYKTIEHTSEGVFKEKGSKFLSFLHPISSELEAKELIQFYKKKYFDARHHCYGIILNVDSSFMKSSDDGEPAHTAGTPILNKLKSYELTNILCVVVRYFGGTKLGVSGLIEAYKEAAEDAIKNCQIVTIDIKETIILCTTFETINELMRICKTFDVKIVNQVYDNNIIEVHVEYTLRIKNEFLGQIEKNFLIRIKAS